MKRSQLVLSTIALPLDYLMLLLAGLLAYQLRFVTFIRDIKPIVFQLPLHNFIPILLIMSVIWIVLFAVAGLYTLRSYLKFSKEVSRLFLGCSAGLALIIVLFFFNPFLFNSRFIVLAGWLLAFVLTTIGRLVLRLVRASLYRRNIATTKILLVGNDQATLVLENLFKQSPGLGFRIISRVDSLPVDKLDDYTFGVDEVIVGDPTLSREANLNILEYCVTHHLGFKYVADMFEAQSHNVVIHTFAGMPLVEIKRTPLDGWGRVAKRIFDLVLSFFLLIILLPIFFIITVLIYLDSSGTAIVALERVGEHGKKFRLYKFRSMICGAEKLKDQLMPYNERADGPLFKMTNDPRVTKFGRILRRTSLDELPQLWNVIRGEMSLVGPRPHEPREVEKYKQHHHKLLNLKSGMTGLAQISGRSNLNFEDEAKLDMFYIENWSLGQDIVILVKTIIVVLQRKSVS
jgi:exopolysaccharide biosynthesis polyprenyl glycosylphosphotransferase